MKNRLAIKLLAYLIPADAREHTLGDLVEGGYRLRDFLWVLLSVWWSYGWRAAFGPVPALAGASRERIRTRARQFAHRQVLSMLPMPFLTLGYLYWVMKMILGAAIVTTFLCILAGLLTAAYTLWAIAGPDSREEWLAAHRKQLRNTIQGWKSLPFSLFALLVIVRGSTWRWNVAIVATWLLIGLYRYFRLRAEFDQLENEFHPAAE